MRSAKVGRCVGEDICCVGIAQQQSIGQCCRVHARNCFNRVEHAPLCRALQIPAQADHAKIDQQRVVWVKTERAMPRTNQSANGHQG